MFHKYVLMTVGLAISAHAQIQWTKVSGLPNPPYFNQWHWLRYDDLNHVTLLWISDSANGPDSIYSDSLWTYDAVRGVLKQLGSNHQPGSGNCIPDSPTWPGSRHPVGQMFWDSLRHRLVAVEGVCRGFNLPDMWAFEATTSAWTEMHPAHIPYPPHNLSSVVHDTDDDVYYLFGVGVYGGYDYDWLYCPTDRNPSRTLSAAQIATGCTAPDDWTRLNIPGRAATHPPGIWMPGLIYDSVHKVIIEFGGMNGNGSIQEPRTWALNLKTKTWTNMNPAGGPSVIPTPAPDWDGQPDIAFNTSDGRIYYHQPTVPPVDWAYDYGTNTWTRLCECGGSPTGMTMVYDPLINGFVQWAYGGPGIYQIWVGKL